MQKKNITDFHWGTYNNDFTSINITQLPLYYRFSFVSPTRWVFMLREDRLTSRNTKTNEKQSQFTLKILYYHFCTIWHHIVPTVLLASIHFLMKCIPFMYIDHTEAKNQVKNQFWWVSTFSVKTTINGWKWKK